MTGRRPGGAGVLATLAVVVIVAHLPLLRADYVQDDHVAVEHNPVVERGDPLEILTSHYWAGATGEDRALYRPVVIASFALERMLDAKANPAISHAINVVLQLTVTLLLFLWSRRVFERLDAALLVSALFAVHPVHLEAVGNVVGRAELLAAGGTLGALLAATHTGPWGDREPRRPMLAGSLCAFGLLVALGSKEIAFAALPLLLLQEWLLRPRDSRPLRSRMTPWIPAAIAVGLFLALRVHALQAWYVPQEPHAMDNPLILLDGADRFRTALGLVARSVGLLFYPTPLVIDYSGPVIPTETSWLAPLPLLGAALLGVLAWWLARGLVAARRAATRRTGVAALGAALFLLPYLIVGNLIVPLGVIFNERLLYLPSIGFCLLAAQGLVWLIGAVRLPGIAARKWLLGAAALIVAAFSILSWQRATEWRDDRRVWEAAVRDHPRSPRAWFMIGKLRGEGSRTAEAIEAYDRALALWPEHVPALVECAALEGNRGNLEAAERHLRDAVRLAPGYGRARANLGIALHRQRRLDEAERELRRALQDEPDYARGWAVLGHVRFDVGEFAGAARAYLRAIELGRTDLEPKLAEARRRSARTR